MVGFVAKLMKELPVLNDNHLFANLDFTRAAITGADEKVGFEFDGLLAIQGAPHFTPETIAGTFRVKRWVVHFSFPIWPGVEP